MAGRISDTSINAVRERRPIEEVIGAHVALRPAGAGRLKGLCPFHDEKTPSFSVNSADGLLPLLRLRRSRRCVRLRRARSKSLTFREAIERLARQLGITLTYEGGGSAANRETGKRSRHIEANKAAAEFYAEQLRTPEGLDRARVPAERGFDAAAAEHFTVGYSPCRLGRPDHRTCGAWGSGSRS